MKKAMFTIAMTVGFAFSAVAGHKTIKVDTHRSYEKPHKHSSHKTHSSHKEHHSQNSRSNRNLYSWRNSSCSSNNSYSSRRSSGYYETVSTRVWIPGTCHQVWVPARYEYRRSHCGTYRRVLVCAGHYETRRSPGRYEYRNTRVWRPAPRRTCNSGINIYWRW